MIVPATWLLLLPAGTLAADPAPWERLEEALFEGQQYEGRPILGGWLNRAEGWFPIQQLKEEMYRQIATFLDFYDNPASPVPGPVEVAPNVFESQTYSGTNRYCFRNRRNAQFGGYGLGLAMLKLGYDMLKREYPNDPRTAQMARFLAGAALHVVGHCLVYNSVTDTYAVAGEPYPHSHQDIYLPHPEHGIYPAQVFETVETSPGVYVRRLCPTGNGPAETDSLRHAMQAEEGLAAIEADPTIPLSAEERAFLRRGVKLLMRPFLSNSPAVGGRFNVLGFVIEEAQGGKLRSWTVLLRLLAAYRMLRAHPEEAEFSAKLGLTILELFDGLTVRYGVPIEYDTESRRHRLLNFISSHNEATWLETYPQAGAPYPWPADRWRLGIREGEPRGLWSWGHGLFNHVVLRFLLTLPPEDVVRRQVALYWLANTAAHFAERTDMPIIRDYLGRPVLNGAGTPLRVRWILGGAFGGGLPSVGTEVARTTYRWKQRPPPGWQGPEASWDWGRAPTSGEGGGLEPWEIAYDTERDEQDPAGVWLRLTRDPGGLGTPMIPLNCMEDHPAAIPYNTDVTPNDRRINNNVVRWTRNTRNPYPPYEERRAGEPAVDARRFPLETASGPIMSMIYDVNRTPPVWRSSYLGGKTAINRNNGFGCGNDLLLNGLIQRDPYYVRNGLFYLVNVLVHGTTRSLRVGQVGELYHPSRVGISGWHSPVTTPFDSLRPYYYELYPVFFLLGWTDDAILASRLIGPGGGPQLGGGEKGGGEKTPRPSSDADSKPVVIPSTDAVQPTGAPQPIAPAKPAASDAASPPGADAMPVIAPAPVLTVPTVPMPTASLTTQQPARSAKQPVSGKKTVLILAQKIVDKRKVSGAHRTRTPRGIGGRSPASIVR